MMAVVLLWHYLYDYGFGNRVQQYNMTKWGEKRVRTFGVLLPTKRANWIRTFVHDRVNASSKHLMSNIKNHDDGYSRSCSNRQQ